MFGKRKPNAPGPEWFPCEIAVTCDDEKCAALVKGDYWVNAGMSGRERLAVARGHLRVEADWECSLRGDFCPTHRTRG